MNYLSSLLDKFDLSYSNDELDQKGELLGYREQVNQSAIKYISHQEDYYFLMFSDIRLQKAYRLDLVFQNKVVKKVGIKREGWLFGANIDPKLLQLLFK